MQFPMNFNWKLWKSVNCQHLLLPKELSWLRRLILSPRDCRRKREIQFELNSNSSSPKMFISSWASIRTDVDDLYLHFLTSRQIIERYTKVNRLISSNVRSINFLIHECKGENKDLLWVERNVCTALVLSKVFFKTFRSLRFVFFVEKSTRVEWRKVKFVY